MDYLMEYAMYQDRLYRSRELPEEVTGEPRNKVLMRDKPVRVALTTRPKHRQWLNAFNWQKLRNGIKLHAA